MHKIYSFVSIQLDVRLQYTDAHRDTPWSVDPVM